MSPGNNNLIRYFIGFSERNISLSRQVNDDFTHFITNNAYHSLGQWHTVDIYGWGGHIRIYVDGKLELEYVDQNYLRGGSIAFETLDDSSAQVDDIEVTGVGDEPPVESYQPYQPPAEPYQPPSQPEQPPAENPPPVEIITPATLPVSCTSYDVTWEENTDRPGMDYWSGSVGDPDTPPSQKPVFCQYLCKYDTTCMAFTYDINTSLCWLKNNRPGSVQKVNAISGIKVCQ